MCTNIAQLLKTAELSLKHSDSARLDAEILLCYVMQISQSKLFAYPEQAVSNDQITHFQSLITQRKQGYPVAYITGKKEFWSLQLSVNKYTLIPRPETETLVQIALQIIPKNAPWNVLDIGTGSGAIAISIASERPHCNIIATDIDIEALKITQENIAAHQLHNIQCLHSNWYKNIPQQTFDIILSNPPYIRQYDKHLLCDGIKFEPKRALVGGIEGMQAINLILQHSKNYLVNRGYLLVEHGYDQKQLVTQAFLCNRFKGIKTLKDIANLDRISYGYK